jgi:hypothetical protein
MKHTIIFITILTLFNLEMLAQNNNDLNSEIEVSKNFEPILIKADKIPITPSLPKFVSEKPEKQNYVFTEKNVPLVYKPEDLKPLKYSSEKSEPLPVVYVKAGFGTQFTPVFQLSVTNRKWNKLKAGLNSDFIMANGKKPENKDYLNFGVKGWGAFQVNNTTLGVEGDANVRRFNYYGKNDSDTLSPLDSNKIKYNDFGFKASIFNHLSNSLGLDYNANFGINWMNNHFDQEQILISIDGDAKKTFKEKIGVGAKFDADHVIINSNGNTSRFNLTFVPYADFKLGIWRLQIGPSLMLTGGDFYFSPYIKNQISIYKNYLVMYNEWTGTHDLKDMKTLTNRNPFLSKNTNYSSNILENRTFAGLKGAFPKGFAYDVRFTQWVEKNTLLFQYDSLDNVLNNFNTVFEKRLAYLNFHSSLQYAYKGMFQAHADVDYFVYNTETNLEAWYKPSLQTQIGLKYLYKNKFTVGFDVNILNGLKSLDENQNVVTLKTIADINLNANYYLNKHIGFFAELNNISTQQYKRWYNYKSYGIQALAGVKITY